MSLTSRQRAAQQALVEHWKANGYAPSLREWAQRLGIKAASVQHYVKVLEEQGYIRREENRYRSITPVRDAEGRRLQVLTAADDLESTPPSNEVKAWQVPLLGQIAAGLPIQMQDRVEDDLLVPPQLLRGVASTDRLFALRVDGESMQPDGIRGGDIVIVRQHLEIIPKRIHAVAIGGEATIKRVQRHEDQLLLIPSNVEYPVQVYHKRDGCEVWIMGVVCGLMRAFS